MENQSPDMEEFPSDGDIESKVNSILSVADLTRFSFKSLMKSLNDEFGFPLTDKKAFVKLCLNKFVENQNRTDSNDDDAEYDDDLLLDDNIIAESTPSKRSGFSAPVQLSNELTDFFGGVSSMPRTEVTKKIWEYIKLNNLQNPKDRREILCDSTLEKLFKRKTINMFKMTKALSQMMKTFDDLQEFAVTKADEKLVELISKESASRKRKLQEATKNHPKELRSEKSTPSKRRQSVKGGENKKETFKDPTKGFHKLYTLSPELATLIGVSQISRPQAVSKVWAYIKTHNLQNPNNKREIINDSEMKSVFKVDTMSMFHIAKILEENFS